MVHKNRFNLVEVDYSRFVAHLRRLMVVAPDCRESHLGVGGAHWDAERRGRSLPVRGRVRVADHEAFSLQDDRLRVILSSRQLRDHGPAEYQYEGVHHGSLSLSVTAVAAPIRKERPSPAPRKFPSPSTGLPRRRRVWRCEILLLDPDMSHIRERHHQQQQQKRIRIKSKPPFANTEITDCSLCVSFSGRLYLKRVEETKVDHVECFREDCSSLWGESVDKSSIALTPTPNNASDNSCSPQWCAACVRAQPSTLRTHMHRSYN